LCVSVLRFSGCVVLAAAGCLTPPPTPPLSAVSLRPNQLLLSDGAAFHTFWGAIDPEGRNCEAARGTGLSVSRIRTLCFWCSGIEKVSALRPACLLCRRAGLTNDRVPRCLFSVLGSANHLPTVGMWVEAHGGSRDCAITTPLKRTLSFSPLSLSLSLYLHPLSPL
jgi:hypothetical protein